MEFLILHQSNIFAVALSLLTMLISYFYSVVPNIYLNMTK